MKPRSFELQIDGLVLRGFESIDTAKFSTILELRLTRLLQASTPDLASRDLTLLNAPAIEVESDAGPEQLADALAQSLYTLLLGGSTASGGAT